MVKYPNNFDTDAELPRVDDNVSEVSSETLNAMRQAIFAIETAIGLNPEGSTASLVSRLSESLNDDGTLKSSALVAAGLIALPITNSMIGASAAIEESKLDLDVATQLLQDQVSSNDVDIAELQAAIAELISKFNRHVQGLGFRHTTEHIDLATALTSVVATNLDDALVEINNRFLDHVDTSKVGAHTASNISVDTSSFQVISPSSIDVQRSLEDLDRSRETLMELHRDEMHANGFGVWSNDQDGYSLYARKYPSSSAQPAIGFVVSGTRNAFEFDGYALSGFNVQQGDILLIEDPDIGGQYVIDDVGPRNAVGSKPSLASDQLEIVGTFADGYASQNVRAFIYTQSSIDNIKTNGAATIRQSDIRVDSVQIARPKAAKVLSLGVQPDLINSTHTLDLEVGVGTGSRTITIDNLNFNRLGSPAPDVTLDTVVERINDVLQNRADGYAFPAAAYRVGDELLLAHNWIGNADIYLKVLGSGTGNFVLGLDGYGADVVDREAYPVQSNYFWVGGKRFTDVAQILSTTANVASTTFTMPSGVNPLTAGVKIGHLLHLKTHTNTNEVGTYFITNVTSSTISIAKTAGITTESDVQIEIYHDALPLDDFNSNLRNQVVEAYLTSDGTLGYNERVSYTDNIGNVSIVRVSDNFLPAEGLALQSSSSGGSTTFTFGSGLPVTVPNSFVGELRVYADTNIEFIVINVSGTPGVGTNIVDVYAHVDEEEFLEVCSVSIDGALTAANLSDKRLFGTIGLDEIREDVVQAYIETPLDELRSDGVVRGLDLLRDADGGIFADGYFDQSLYPSNQGIVFRGGTAYVGGARCDLVTTPVPFPNVAGTFTVVLNALGTYKIIDTNEFSLAEIIDGYAGAVIPMATVVHDGNLITSAEDRRFFINQLDDKVELIVDTTNRRIGNFATVEAAVGWIENYPFDEKFRLRYVSNVIEDVSIPSMNRDITLVLDGRVSNLYINTNCRIISESLANRGRNHVDGYLVVGGDCEQFEANNLSLSGVNLSPGSSDTRYTFRDCYFDGYGSREAIVQFVSGTYDELNFFNCVFGNNSILDLSGSSGGLQHIDNCVFTPGSFNTDYYQVGVSGFLSKVTNCYFDLAGVDFSGGSFGDNILDNCIFQNVTPDASVPNVVVSGGVNNGPVIMTNCTFNTVATSSNGETLINLQSAQSNVVSNCNFLGGGVASGDQLMNVVGTISDCLFGPFSLPTTQSITCDSFYNNYAQSGSDYLVGAREFVGNSGIGSVTSKSASEELRVVSNNVFENSSQGFNVELTDLDSGDACSVTGNWFSVSGATDMTCVTFPSTSVIVSVASNTFDGDGYDVGLALAGVSGVIVSANRFETLDAFSTTGQINRCVFNGNSFNDSGFSVQIGNNNVFTNNSLNEGTQAFTGASGATDFVLSDNIFGTNTTLTLSPTTLDDATISGNTFDAFNLDLGSSMSDCIITQNIGVIDSSTTFTASDCALSFNSIDYDTINNITWDNSFISNNVFTNTGNTEFTLASTGGGVDANVLIQENIFNSTGASAIQISSANPVRAFFMSQNVNGSGAEATILFNSQVNQAVIEGNLNFNINVANGSSASSISDNMMPNDQLTLGGTCNSTLITNNYMDVVLANCASTTGLVMDGNFISNTLDIISGVSESISISGSSIINNYVVNGINVFDSPVGDGYSLTMNNSFIANNNIGTGGLDVGSNGVVGDNFSFNITDLIIQGNNFGNANVDIMNYGTVGTSPGLESGGLRVLNNSFGVLNFLGTNNWDAGSEITDVRISGNSFNTFQIIADAATSGTYENIQIVGNILVGESTSNIQGIAFDGLYISNNIVEGTNGDIDILCNNTNTFTDLSGDNVALFTNLEIASNSFQGDVTVTLNVDSAVTGTTLFTSLQGFRFINNTMTDSTGFTIETQVDTAAIYFVAQGVVSGNRLRHFTFNQTVGQTQSGEISISNNIFIGPNSVSFTPEDPGVYIQNSSSSSGHLFSLGSITNNAVGSVYQSGANFTSGAPDAVIRLVSNSSSQLLLGGVTISGNAGLSLILDSLSSGTSGSVQLTESVFCNNSQSSIVLNCPDSGDTARISDTSISNNAMDNTIHNTTGVTFEGSGSGSLELEQCLINANYSDADWDFTAIDFFDRATFSNNHVDGYLSFNSSSLTSLASNEQLTFIGNHADFWETTASFNTSSSSETFFWGNTGKGSINLTVAGTNATDITTANNITGGRITN